MRPYTVVLSLFLASVMLTPALVARGHEDREPRDVESRDVEPRESRDQRDLDRQARDAERRQRDAAREQEKARQDAERDSVSTASDSGGASGSGTSGSNSGSSDSGSGSGTSGSSSSGSGSNSGSSDSGSDDNSGSNSGSSDSGSDDNSGSNSGSSDSGSDNNSGSNSGSSDSDDDSGDDSDDDSDSGSDDDEIAATGGNRIDIETDSEGHERRRGELLVRGGRDLGDTLRAAGFKVLSLRHLSNLGQSVARVRLREGSSIEADRHFVRRIGNVTDAEPNYVFRLSGAETAQATRKPATATGSANIPPLDAIRVGVVDTGADPAAPGLGGGLLISRAFGGAYTARTHGTHVAQILIREGVRVELADVFQTDGRGEPVATAESIARGIDWLASRRLPVINVSITGPRSSLLSDVVARAIARGSIVVAAAGNDGPAAPPTYPAAFPEVVGVTAVDADGRVYRRANRGEYVDFAAFGVRVPVSGDGGRVDYISGTSYAAPLVAATIARGYRQARPEAATDEVAALRGRVLDLGDRGRDPVFGWGVLSLPAAKTRATR